MRQSVDGCIGCAVSMQVLELNLHGIGFPVPKVLACREIHVLVPVAELTLLQAGHLPKGWSPR